jgi:hypothetical protein
VWGEARYGPEELCRAWRKRRPLLLRNRGNVFTEALPINSLNKSVTILCLACTSFFLTIFPRNLHLVSVGSRPLCLYCSLYRCYATVVRRNVHCLVAACKHISNIWPIARQPPITTIEKLLDVVFSFVSAPRLYSENPRLAE